MKELAILCPVGNTCTMTAKHFPECGTATHLTPDMTVDQLCPAALKKAIPNEETNYLRGDRGARRRTTSEFRRGSLHFELAGALKDKVIDSASHYSQANSYLMNAESRSVRRFSRALSAALFRLYSQPIRDAASSLTLEQTHELQAGLVQLADRLGDQDTRSVHQARSKMAFHMLFTTRGIPALPASARQGGTLFEGARPESGYDFSLINAETGHVIPHRLTSSEDHIQYTGPCVAADFPALAMRAMDEVAPGEITDVIQAGNLGFSLLCDHLEGYNQDEPTLNVLRTMGDMALDQAYSFQEPHTS